MKKSKKMPMTPEQVATYRKIKSLLAARGIGLYALSQELGVSASLLTYVLQGRKKSRRTRVALASALNKTVEELWTC